MKEAPVHPRRLLALLLTILPAAAGAQFIGPGDGQGQQAQQGGQTQQQGQQQGQPQQAQQGQGQQQGAGQPTQSPRKQAQQGQDGKDKDAEGSKSSLRYLGQFRGPYKGTSITKFQDPQNGVTCYVYAPSSIPYRTPLSGGISYGSNSVGSISCVE
jgi:hypothetical protein